MAPPPPFRNCKHGNPRPLTITDSIVANMPQNGSTRQAAMWSYHLSSRDEIITSSTDHPSRHTYSSTKAHARLLVPTLVGPWLRMTHPPPLPNFLICKHSSWPSQRKQWPASPGAARGHTCSAAKAHARPPVRGPVWPAVQAAVAAAVGPGHAPHASVGASI